MKKNIFIFSLICVICIKGIAQTPVQVLRQWIPTDTWQFACNSTMVDCGNGTVNVAGQAINITKIICTDTMLNMSWGKIIQGYTITDLTTNQLNQNYLIGADFNITTPWEGSTVIKLNSNGTHAWSKLFSNPDDPIGPYQYVVCEKNGNHIYATMTYATVAALIKMDALSNVIWKKEIELLPGYTGCGSIGLWLKNNRLITVGNMGGANENLFILSTDTAGNVLVKKQILFNANLINCQATTDNLGNTYMAGRFGASNDMMYLKIDTTGTVKWAKIITNLYEPDVIQVFDNILFIQSYNDFKSYRIIADTSGTLLGATHTPANDYFRECVRNASGIIYTAVSHYNIAFGDMVPAVQKSSLIPPHFCTETDTMLSSVDYTGSITYNTTFNLVSNLVDSIYSKTVATTPFSTSQICGYLTEIPETPTVNEIRVFPTLIDNFVTTEIPQGEMAEMRIYSLTGSLLYTCTIAANNPRHDVSYLSSGPLVIEILTNNEIYRYKAIKQ